VTVRAFAVAIGASLAFAAPAGAALSIGIGTPLSALVIRPGATATSSGTLVITPGVGSWSLSAHDATGHAGHLVPAGGAACTGVEPQTANPLTVSASGIAAGTTSTGSKVVGSSPQTIVSGLLADTVSVTFGLTIGQSERIAVGCPMSTTVTYTLQ
jgi:hypothetical protein